MTIWDVITSYSIHYTKLYDDHECTTGDWCEQNFGPDICFLDREHGGGGNGRYMLDRGREWLVWLTRQLGADGFRFDAVKHYPAYRITSYNVCYTKLLRAIRIMG